MPAPVAMRISSFALPVSTSKAAAQRVPLPEISLRLPSEFHSSMAACAPSVPGPIRIQPSAPMPVCRSQIARSQRGGIASLDGQLIAPGQQEIVARAVRFCKRNLHLFAMVDVLPATGAPFTIICRRSVYPAFCSGGIDRIARKCQPHSTNPSHGDSRSGRAMAASNAAWLPSCKPSRKGMPASRRTPVRSPNGKMIPEPGRYSLARNTGRLSGPVTPGFGIHLRLFPGYRR